MPPEFGSFVWSSIIVYRYGGYVHGLPLGKLGDKYGATPPEFEI